MSEAALWVSKALSYAILVGSLIMQAPQIYKIVKARSAAGITAMGWAISVFSMTRAAPPYPWLGCQGSASAR